MALKHFSDFFTDIKKLKKVFFESTSTPFILKNKITALRIKSDQISNPISLLKAMKNPIELKGSIKSHEKDGVALLRFIRWLKSTKIETLSEITLVKKLEELRKSETSFFYKRELCRNQNAERVSYCRPRRIKKIWSLEKI